MRNFYKTGCLNVGDIFKSIEPSVIIARVHFFQCLLSYQIVYSPHLQFNHTELLHSDRIKTNRTLLTDLRAWFGHTNEEIYFPHDSTVIYMEVYYVW